MTYVAPPTSLVATNTNSTTNTLTWTNGATYTTVLVYRNSVYLKTVVPGTLTTTTDATISSNVGYTYTVKGVTAVGTSDFSNPSTVGYYVDTVTDVVTTLDDPSFAATAGNYEVTETETVNCEDIAIVAVDVEVPNDYADTVTDTVTCTDTVIDSIIAPQNYQYYMGSSTGMVYAYDEEEHGDNGSAINAYWKSKRLDFSDTKPEYQGMWKTIEYVLLTYVDKSEVTVTVSVSTDGGVTWDGKTKTFGTGTGRVLEKPFHFWKTGRFFNIKMANNSSTEDFQWIKLTAHVTPQAEQFATA